jgi:hypothetical protein
MLNGFYPDKDVIFAFASKTSNRVSRLGDFTSSPMCIPNWAGAIVFGLSAKVNLF